MQPHRKLLARCLKKADYLFKYEARIAMTQEKKKDAKIEASPLEIGELPPFEFEKEETFETHEAPPVNTSRRQKKERR